jgi:hypothetical protein
MAKNKRKTAPMHNMHSYFGKKGRVDQGLAVDDGLEQNNSVDSPELIEQEPEDLDEEIPIAQPTPAPTVQRGNDDDSAVLIVQRDPGLRCQIWDYPPNVQEKARLAYMKHGPYQFQKDEYPLDDAANHPRKFQYHWFKTFPWLEYSPTTDAVYCFPCFLFYRKPLGRKGSDKFTVEGFRKWKKVNSGKDCAFLTHMGKDSKSAHNYALKCYDNLKNKSCHMEQLVERQTEEDIKRNRLRLKVTIDVLRWLTFQACAFRGHDESVDSKNQGNFLEMVKLLAAYDDEIGAVVLGNAPQNARYTSPMIQKEILHIIASNVQSEIRKEIGAAKFCLLVDESRDESKREQMAVVIRFVDKKGFTRERFLDIIHVLDTTSATLKHELSSVLVQHQLDVLNIRGQGYDGASNMRGEWNGLQAKFMEECPYAYYVHCFAHQLQLALVAASKEVADVHNFFDHLALIVTTVVSSSKRNDELHAHQVAEMENLIELSELETGRGANQVGTLQRPCDTRWSSHYASVCSLLKLYKPTFLVLKSIATSKGSGTSPSARAKASGAVKLMMSFDFIFILHVMKELMGITDLLCKKLQQKSQDIVNAMDDVKTTKLLIQELRDNGWSKLKGDVLSFCVKQGVKTPEFGELYVDFINSRAEDESTVEHHYRCEIFMVVVDQQAQELNCRFNKQATELLIMCTSLDPKNSFSSFNIDIVCSLASKFYPADFEEQERENLRCQLRHYEHDIPTNPKFQNLTTISELCQQLAATGKNDDYHLIDRYIMFYDTVLVDSVIAKVLIIF